MEDTTESNMCADWVSLSRIALVLKVFVGAPAMIEYQKHIVDLARALENNIFVFFFF